MTDRPPLRLAATAIPLRDGPTGPELLMVRRSPDLSFGGLWTFPGGAFEPADGPAPERIDETTIDWSEASLVATARNAAVRETLEETALDCPSDTLTWLSHWVPPAENGPPKRFATWFFLAPECSGDLVLDERENDEARWITPARAQQEHADGAFPLAPPTLVTLIDLDGAPTVDELMSGARNEGVASALPAAAACASSGRMAATSSAASTPSARAALLTTSRSTKFCNSRTLPGQW